MGEQLVGALEDLRARLSILRLPLACGEADHARQLVAAGVAQLDDYVLPRLRSLDAPLLAVVAGSTGSGKSTLVNALVGREVSRAGVLRPTTRHPVLVHHPEDARWFRDERILPRLPRVTGGAAGSMGPGGGGLVLVADGSVPRGLALLDSPDIDSVEASNRALAGTLMSAADLWLFVTSAARYSDAVPWEALRAAVARDAAVALVLDRVPPAARREVTDHLRSMLSDAGLSGAPLFVVPESTLRDGLPDPADVATIRSWLADLAGDAGTRSAVARRTLDGAVSAMVVGLATAADAADRQVVVAGQLSAVASTPFRAAAARVVDLGADGSMLRGEVLARWQEFVGAGEAFRRLESGVSRVRDRIAATFRGEPTAPEEVAGTLETGLVRVLVDEVTGACDAADAAWRDDPAGLGLLAGDDLCGPPAGARARAEELVRGWHGDVLDLIRAEGAGKRATARALAYGVNGAAVAVMVLVFSTTGGLTGAEVGIAGGAAVLAQKLLEALFSEDAVRRMSQTARERFEARVASYFDSFEQPFRQRVEALGLDPGAGDRLREALGRVERLLSEAGARPLPHPPHPPEPTRPGARSRMRTWWRGER